MATKIAQQTAWALARAQHGVITRIQLLALGFTIAAIRHRISEGRLHPVYSGVYAVGRPDLSREGELMAAVLACGDTAALSHDSAAELWGIARRKPGPIHVSVVGTSRSHDGLVVHRRTVLKATTHQGIRVATPAQTLIDVAWSWPEGELEQAIGEADLRGRIGLRALRTAATKAGRSGAPLRSVIERVTFRVTQSELEREFLRVLARAKLPLPATQQRFGRWRVDFYWPELGLIVETDGGSFHRTPYQQQKDRERDQAHIRAGRTPMRITHGQVFHEPEATRELLTEVADRLAKTTNPDRPPFGRSS
jgi:very-short-patch-repair endonuclease